MQAKMIERMVADLRMQSRRRDAQTSDAALLEAFIAGRDQAAFAALVQRHGPMVLGVCRRILGHAQDAEDAFQAAFWVLARKSSTVRPRGLVGHWLYGVAVRTALKARGLRRRRREQQVDAMPPPIFVPGEVNDDVCALLDQEIARLPAKYRLAVVLCELEGRGRKEAAEQLRIAEGTLSSRLAYARKLLARRLQARGVAWSAGGALLAGAAVPPSLLASALQAATATAPASATVSTLVKGVMTAMFLSKLKQIAAAALLGVVVLGFAMGSRHLWADAEAGQPPAAPNPAQARQAAPARQPVVEPIQAGKPDSEIKDGLSGLWRVLQVETRSHILGGMGGDAFGPMGGAAGAAPPIGPGGPLSGLPIGHGMGGPGGNRSIVYDGATGKAFLVFAKDQVTFTHRGEKVTHHLTLGSGTIDWRHQDADQTATSQGIYVRDGGQLRLGFAPPAIEQKGAPLPLKHPRPKSLKDAYEVWTLARQPSRQEIYQKLDQLQGDWKAVSGESNGEAFLPRELKNVRLHIRDGDWKMTPPDQPGQPDAVPRRFFGAGYEFVIDSDGPRSILILKSAGQRPIEQRMLYELRGDELKICWSVRWPAQGGDQLESPKEFRTAPGSDHVMFVLRRESSAPKAGPMGPSPGGAPVAPGTGGDVQP